MISLINEIGNKIALAIPEEYEGTEEYRELSLMLEVHAKTMPPYLKKKYMKYVQIIDKMAKDEAHHGRQLEKILKAL